VPIVPRARSLLRNWFRSRQVEGELDAELNACLDQLTEEKIAAGLSPREALRAARIELGGVEQVKKQVREARAGSFLVTVWQDLRYGMRGMARSPIFTAVVVATLALGIGANTAIFSLVDALLLEPPPAQRPEELVMIYTSVDGDRHGLSSYPDCVDLRDRNDVLSGLIAFKFTPLNLSAGAPGDSAGQNERVWGEVVSGDYFSLLGIEPVLGRGFLPEEERTPGSHPVALVSHSLWQRRFAGDPSTVGRNVRLNGHRFTIVGVAPPGFRGMHRGLAADVWVPAMMKAQATPGAGGPTEADGSFLLMGRLRPGVTIEQAQARFDVIAAELHRTRRESWTDASGESRVITLVPESGARIFNPSWQASVTLFMALLMTVVGLVLLLACANVANLLLARASARRKELAIRLAVGAGRARLVRQLLTESLLVATLGGIAGLVLALWGSDLLLALRPPLPVPLALDLALDWRVIAFTAGVTTLTTGLIGLAPALAASRGDPAAALVDDAGGCGPRRARLPRVLVVVQVTLSLVLLIGSGLFLRSLHQARAIPLGFDPSNVMTVSFDLGLQGYSEGAGQDFHRRLLERVRDLPGVTQASLTAELPLGLRPLAHGLMLEGEEIVIGMNKVAPGYFETMKIPVVKGRVFTERDDRRAPGVVVVNQAFARRYWPGQEALGQRIPNGGGDLRAPSLEVVGVVSDGKYETLGEEPRPFFYAPLWQAYHPSASLIVRTTGSPESETAAVRSAVERLDANLPVYDVKTMTQHLEIKLLPARMAGTVLGVFGLLALSLAALGLYGVVSYSVSQRTREIGVRVALGARPRDVVKMVIGQGMRLTAIGLVIGVAAAWGLSRLLSGMLYGVSAADPVTFAGVTFLLAAVAFFACYLPARRAARVQPMVALRHE
jgi:macrolide transport system ATP-binding/permease protein